MVLWTSYHPQEAADFCCLALLLDAFFFAMIPEVVGDFAPLGQRLLGVLPFVRREWASLRFAHLQDWVQGWIPQSVFRLGNEVSSVEAWFSTALDIEEVLSGAGIISCMSWLLMLSSPLTQWIGVFWTELLVASVYPVVQESVFSFHNQVRLRFELAAGLGGP